MESMQNLANHAGVSLGESLEIPADSPRFSVSSLS